MGFWQRPIAVGRPWRPVGPRSKRVGTWRRSTALWAAWDGSRWSNVAKAHPSLDGAALPRQSRVRRSGGRGLSASSGWPPGLRPGKQLSSRSVEQEDKRKRSFCTCVSCVLVSKNEVAGLQEMGTSEWRDKRIPAGVMSQADGVIEFIRLSPIRLSLCSRPYLRL